MQYNTMFSTVHRQSFSLPDDSDIVRPDLSFSIKEIKEKFTLQHLLAENRDVQKNYLLSADSDEFDSASAEIPQNYDLVDAFSDSRRVYNARMEYVSRLRSSRENAKESNGESTPLSEVPSKAE